MTSALDGLVPPKGDRVPLKVVARELGVHLSTVWRWCLKGTRGRKLRTFTIGGRVYVSRVDLADFLEPDRTLPTATPAASSRNRRRSIEQAKREVAEFTGSRNTPAAIRRRQTRCDKEAWAEAEKLGITGRHRN